MKIYLDLLPDYRKKEIKRKKIFRTILGEEVLFILPIILFILILVNIYYVLILQKNALISSNSIQQTQDSKYQKLGTYQEKFKQVNDLDQVLGKIQAGHLHWNNLFQKLSETTPDGIYINTFSTKNYALFLVGRAKTREDLLNFKKELESNTCFNSINVPLSNLVVKNDVDFQIDLKINEECLRKQ